MFECEVNEFLLLVLLLLLLFLLLFANAFKMMCQLIKQASQLSLRTVNWFTVNQNSNEADRLLLNITA